MDMIKGWLLTYLLDGKRLTAAVLAVLNLMAPKMAEAGVPLPEPTKLAFASFLAIAILSVWSKLTAKATVAPAPPMP